MEKESNNKVDQNSKPNGIVNKFRSFKKTPFLIAGLVILTGILLAVSLNLGSKPKAPSSKPQTLQEDFARTSLSISEDIRESTKSGVFEVDVNIDTGDNLVTGAQLELTYDPKSLTNVDINQGQFFDNPQLILKEVDEKTGRITLVIGIRPEQTSITGEGIVAVISFEKATDEDTFINFLPQTLISAVGYNQSVLKETISAVIRELPE